MALIVEDGTGIENADTYIDTDYFDTYCSNMGYSSHSASASTVSKEAHIRRGMVYIEGLLYDGIKAQSTNDLAHPRSLLYHKGILIDSNVIHSNVKKATAEAAYREELSANSLLPDVDAKGDVKRKKTDVLETEYFDGSKPGIRFSIIQTLLQDFLINDVTIELHRSIG